MRRHANSAPVTGAALSNTPSQPARRIGLLGILLRDSVISRSDDYVVSGVTGEAVAPFCQLFTRLRVASLQFRARPGCRLDQLRGEQDDDEQSDGA